MNLRSMLSATTMVLLAAGMVGLGAPAAFADDTPPTEPVAETAPTPEAPAAAEPEPAAEPAPAPAAEPAPDPDPAPAEEPSAPDPAPVPAPEGDGADNGAPPGEEPVMAQEAEQSLRTAESQTPPVDVDYVTVAWLAPGGAPPHHFDVPQQLQFSEETDDPELDALDGEIAAYLSRLKCGTDADFQVDVYVDDPTTDALIAGGYLNGPDDPEEHLIPGGEGTAWKFVHLDADPCPKVTPDVPEVKDLCGTADDHYGLPDNEPGITYTRSGLDIMATLDAGYVFDTLPAGYVDNGNGTATYAFSSTTWTDEPCDLPTAPLVIPTVVGTDPTCTAGASYTLSNDQAPGAVLWTVNGTPGVADGTYPAALPSTVTIEAAPNAPTYGFSGGQQTTWTFTFGSPSGCLETLALTGSGPLQAGGLAGLLTLAGLIAVLSRARNRGSSPADDVTP